MKTLMAFCFALFLIVGCKDKASDKEVEKTTDTATAAQADTSATTAVQPGSDSFDISSVPVSDKTLGDFPFFSVPEGMSYQVEQDKKLHRTYFGVKGKLIPLEGRTFAALVHSKSGSSADFEPLVFEKHYDDLIKSAGGVLISNTKVASAEIQRVGQDELFKYRNVADIYNDPVKCYLVRRANGEIWVQIASNSAAGSITVIQKGELDKNTVAPQAPAEKKD